MIEVIKKLPILISLITGKPLYAIEKNTKQITEIRYSQKEKVFTIQHVSEGTHEIKGIETVFYNNKNQTA